MPRKENEIEIHRADGYVKHNTSPNQAQVKFDSKTAEGKVFNDMGIRYAKALEQAGLNVENPIIANAVYYNKSGMNFADPPQTGRSFVFITRPDLNFARANIRSEPYFDMLYETGLGRMLFPMLTHPDRYINHEYTTDDFPKHESISDKFWNLVKAAQDAWFGPGSDSDAEIVNVNDNDLYTDEIIQTMAEYKSSWDVNSPDPGSKIETQKNEWGNDKEYDFRMNKEPSVKIVDARTVQRGYEMPINYSKKQRSKYTYCDMAHFRTPFIPLLMNHCLEVSAGKDFIISSKEFEGDFFGGKMTYAAGADETNAPGELNLVFRDNYYRMIFNLFHTWLKYIHLVSRGDILPRISNIWEKVLDYTCSIYVFVTDKDFSTLVGWAKYTGCRPVSLSMAGIKHSSKGDLNSDWEQLTIPFAYNHAEYMTPEILTDFNYVAGTEYNRVINKKFPGFSLFNSQTKKYTGDQLFTKITSDGSSGLKMGVSGATPERVLKINAAGELTEERMSKEDENAFLNSMMPANQRITFNPHWDGYPMVVSQRLIWTHRVRHKLASETRGVIDDNADQVLSQQLQQNQQMTYEEGDPEATEESVTALPTE